MMFIVWLRYWLFAVNFATPSLGSFMDFEEVLSRLGNTFVPDAMFR